MFNYYKKYSELANIEVIISEPCIRKEPYDYGEIDLNEISIKKVSKILKHLKIKKGGHYLPNCNIKYIIAVIVPIRNRDAQIPTFLRHYHLLMSHQKLNYRIFMIEQSPEGPFNRAKLFNIGFTEANKYDKFECFIFHDVDFILTNSSLEYDCTHAPAHYVVSSSQYSWGVCFPSFFGGVNIFTSYQFVMLNGYSNCYWAHGVEDDDMHRRVLYAKMKIYRPPKWEGRYLSNNVKHVTVHNKTLNKLNVHHFSTNYNTSLDGLSDLNYKLISTKLEELYTRIKVDVLYPDHCEDHKHIQ